MLITRHTRILEQAQRSNGDALREASAMKQLQTIIRTNERVAVALGSAPGAAASSARVAAALRATNGEALPTG